MEQWPKFRPDLDISIRKEYGFYSDVVIRDPVSQKFYRLSKEELRFLKEFDGHTSLEDAVENVKSWGIYYDIDDAKAVVGKAAQMGLMLGSKFSSAHFQKGLRDNIKKAKAAQRFSSVYFLFIPLINPDRFLDRTVHIFKFLCNQWTVGLAAILFPGALYLFITGLPRVFDQYLYFFNLENLLYLWFAIAITKLIHEFAHAYTAKLYGLRVPRMGLAFLIFFPCLYCDTTDAWNLAGRRQRMAIAGAGILAETALAIISTYIWYFTKPGIINSLAFYQMTTSFVSTVMFNGNPLLKFDGYFILIDYLNLPNLQQKAFGYIKYLFLNKALGMTLVPNTSSGFRESSLFTVYGISAVIYRCLLYTGIVAGVYYRFDKLLGLTLAVVAFFLFIVRPVSKGILFMIKQRNEIRPRPIGALIVAALVALLILVLVIPWSSNSVYPCYLDSAESQKLTAPIQSSISQLFIEKGDIVEEGTILFQLDSKRLELSRKNKDLEREILEREIQGLLLDQSTMAEASEKIIELSQVKHELKLLQKELELAQNGVKAPFKCMITALDPMMRPGYQPGEGAVVGELESWKRCVVKTLIPENDAARLEIGQAIKFWFPGHPSEIHKANIESIKHYSEQDIADSPFSSRLGGEVATEQKGEQTKDAPLAPQYIFLTSFRNVHSIPLRIAGKCAVVFPPRSLIQRIVNAAAQTFNRESIW